MVSRRAVIAAVVTATLVGVTGLFEVPDTSTAATSKRPAEHATTAATAVARDTSEVTATGDVGTPSRRKPVNRADSEPNPAAVLVLVLGFRPSLVSEQVSQLLQSRQATIVLLCPTADDADEAHRQPWWESGRVSAVHHPVVERAALFNGRYLFEAAHEFLVQLNSTSPAQGPTSHSSAKYIAVFDPTRALLCGDVLSQVPRDHLGLISIPVSRKSSFLAEYTKAFVFATEPRFRTLDLSPATVRLSLFVFSPQFFCGPLAHVRIVIRRTLHRIVRQLSGFAIEPAFSDAVRQTLLDATVLRYSIDVEHRRMMSPCGGAEGWTTQRKLCDKWRHPVVIVNHPYCDPEAPKLNHKLPSAAQQPGADRQGSDVTPTPCLNVFTLPMMAINTSRPVLEAAVAKSAPLAVSAWKSAAASLRRRSSCFSTAASDSVDFVIGVAFGYTPERIRPFLTTFKKHHRRNVTKLLLLVTDQNAFVSSLNDADISKDVLVRTQAEYAPPSNASLQSCPVVLSRMEVIRNALQALSASYCVGRVLILDTRDALFQSDPFLALDRLEDESSKFRATGEFLLFPVERFLLAQHDFLFFGPHVLNRFWVGGAFGMDFFYRLAREPVLSSEDPSDGVTYPILCGGLYLGSAAAMLDFLDLFVSTAIALGGCSVNDQGLLVGLVAVGLGASRFPHDVWFSDPYTTPFTNGPRGGTEIAWDLEGQRLVNCRGEPYSVLHQLDRYPAVWRRLLQ